MFSFRALIHDIRYKYDGFEIYARPDGNFSLLMFLIKAVAKVQQV